MKYPFSALALALLLCQNALASLPPMLQDSQCSLSLGMPEINFGNQTRYQLDEVGAGQLSPGTRELTLAVACPYSQAMKLALRGDRAQNGAFRYGERGSVKIRLFNARVDGQPAELMRSGNAQATSSNSIALQPGETFVAVRGGAIQQGKTFTAQVEITPLLPESAARATQLSSSEARLTLELLR